ncbi:hypothetical protein [uncultured Desulfobacter sp.]|uniref:hypothetical protein n=1 Tax=uncultured Desulfobacter sp. TaxID=240139 RepID=UPI002AA83FCA|nr:hypothetical protein [uncultured Desulfobacter sp.]
MSNLEKALTLISFELLAVKEFCQNWITIDHTGKNGSDAISKGLSKDISVAFARMATNTAILIATKLSEIMNHKHLPILMEVLDSNATLALNQRVCMLETEKLKFLRDKVVAHIDPVPYQDLDAALEEICPDKNLWVLIDILESEQQDTSMSSRVAIHRLLTALETVPGYEIPS